MKTSASKTGKMENSEFHKFFVDELKDIYWAEKHLVKALPKMKKESTSPELAAAFRAANGAIMQHEERILYHCGGTSADGQN